MSSRNLTLLGGFLVLIGILPLVLMGTAVVLSFISGCTEVIGIGADTSCPHNQTQTGGRIANMMLAGLYTPIAVPIGLVGAIMLFVVHKRRKRP